MGDVEQLDRFTQQSMCVEPMSPAERQLRDCFVDEYLVDYDSYAAALRVGFSSAFAVEYARKFMQEPYVRQRIKLKEHEQVATEEEDTKRIIRAQLIKEATYHGSDSSHGARVSALAKLMSLYGMDAPTKNETKVDVTTPTVQFYLPAKGSAV